MEINMNRERRGTCRRRSGGRKKIGSWVGEEGSVRKLSKKGKEKHLGKRTFFRHSGDKRGWK